MKSTIETAYADSSESTDTPIELYGSMMERSQRGSKLIGLLEQQYNIRRPERFYLSPKQLRLLARESDRWEKYRRKHWYSFTYRSIPILEF